MKTHEAGIDLDVSKMNKNEQIDLAEHLRLKLKKLFLIIPLIQTYYQLK